MDSRMGNNAASNKNTFDPLSDLIQEEECNTLLFYLPGFTKEQLRVQLIGSRVLKISGSRPIGDNNTSSFQKDFPVSENIDTNKITAKFEDGILYVRQPKLIVPAEKDDRNTPPLQPPQSQKPAEKPPAAPKPDQERRPTAAAPKTTPHAEDSKQAGAKDLTKKSQEKKEEKISEPEGGRKYVPKKTDGVDQDKKVAAGKSDGDKRHEKISGANVNAVDDYKKVNAAAMLKVAREKTMKILLFLFAFALGMYVSKLRWVSREVEN